MPKKMKNAYEMTLNDDNTLSPIMKSQPVMFSGQTSNVGATRTSVRSSSAALDAAIEHEIRMGTLDPNMDKKAMRRIISNRYAAKKSHDKMINKMHELEKNRKDLENTIATLQPQIEHESQLLSHLRIENQLLAQQLHFHIDLNHKKEAQIAEKTMERQWLRGLLNMQVQQQPGNGGTDVFDLQDFDPNNFPYVSKSQPY
ncbi:unnamed protein product [Lactuca saligna]|uniref:BZIP domain-containing protein n=1 Tax=Lactuca saligna TaxID=75948 RepID=A0AA35ZZF9_LACSI|nr:unnamed protein product [Lactuca saligna]